MFVEIIYIVLLIYFCLYYIASNMTVNQKITNITIISFMCTLLYFIYYFNGYLKLGYFCGTPVIIKYV